MIFCFFNVNDVEMQHDASPNAGFSMPPQET